MNVNNAFELGQTVFLMHKDTRDPGIVLQICAKLGGTITYNVGFTSGDDDWHFAEQLSPCFDPMFPSEDDYDVEEER